MFEFHFRVDVSELETGKWAVEVVDGPPIRAFGTTREDAFGRFIAVYELYREHGEDWMAAVLAEKNEEFVDANIEMNGDPWTPDGAL